jgi:hypothetical protein
MHSNRNFVLTNLMYVNKSSVRISYLSDATFPILDVRTSNIKRSEFFLAYHRSL